MPEPVQIEYTRPWMYPKQERAFFGSTRYSDIEASTKSGKTVGAIAWLIEETMRGQAGQQFWWVAPIRTQSRIAFRRLRDGIPASLRKVNETELTIKLLNDAIIAFKSGEIPDNLYGEDVYGMVIDEASRLREEAWHACRTTLTATRGRARIISNVRGKKNWAYKRARRAEAGAPDMEYHRITADDAVEAGVLDADEIADAEATLPRDVFRQLYYCEPADDEGNPFGLEAIDQCVGPLSSREPKLWGWDLAKYTDWTAGIALDEDGAVCRFLRFQKPWEETITTIRETVERTPTLIDATGVGDPIVERLQREVYGMEGFVFTSKSKQQLMEGLAIAISHREITFPEGPIAIELRQFEYVYTRTGVKYAGADGTHDDCVCALALAVKMREQSRGQQRWAPVEEGEEAAVIEPHFYEVG